MSTRRMTRTFASLVLPVAVFGVLLYFLLRTLTTEIYGFEIAADPYLLFERGFQFAPLLAALTLPSMLDPTERFVDKRFNHPRSLTRVLISSFVLAIVYTLVAVGIILAMAASDGASPFFPALKLLLIGFIFDLLLVVIFVQFLQSLARKWYFTTLAILGYAVLVIVAAILGVDVAFIGFGTTSDIVISSHASQAIGTSAAWVWRAYWLSVSVGMLVALTAIFPSAGTRPPEPTPMPVATTPGRKERAARGYAALFACALATLALGWFLHGERAAIAAAYPSQVDKSIVSNEDEPRPRLVEFSISLERPKGRRAIEIDGTARLENSSAKPISVIYLEKAQVLSLSSVQSSLSAEVVGSDDSRLLALRLVEPLQAGAAVDLSWTGSINAENPFDTAAQTLVMDRAFFLPSAAILPVPRKASCLMDETSELCRADENYLLSDPASGQISISAPSSYVVPGAQAITKDGDVARFERAISPRNQGNFLVAASHFRSFAMEGPNGKIIRSYAAPYSDTEPDKISEFVSKEVDALAANWCSLPLARLDILEVPHSFADATAYGDSIAVSERFMGRKTVTREFMSELTRMILTHELVHQWLGYQVIPERAPGRAIVLESLAQYAALRRTIERGEANFEDIRARGMNSIRLADSLSGHEANYELSGSEAAGWREYLEAPLIFLSFDQQSSGLLGQSLDHKMSSVCSSAQSTAPKRFLEDVLTGAGRSLSNLDKGIGGI